MKVILEVHMLLSRSSERGRKGQTLFSALSLKVRETLRVFPCQWRKSITDRIRQVSSFCCPENSPWSSTHMFPTADCVCVRERDIFRTCVTVDVVCMLACSVVHRVCKSYQSTEDIWVQCPCVSMTNMTNASSSNIRQPRKQRISITAIQFVSSESSDGFKGHLGQSSCIMNSSSANSSCI